MDKELVDQITKSMTDSVEKALPEIVDNVVSKKVAEFITKSAEEVEEIKTELKKINLNSKVVDVKANDLMKKGIIVNIFKDVMNNNITTEQGFHMATEKAVKSMNEGTNGQGAELVFDQFETDILRVINEFQIVNDVKILPLAKGDKVSLPKATNGITTFFIAEGAAYTASESTTAFISIDIAKACTLTDMTQELLDDTMTTPDLYNLIVEHIGESQGQFLETQILLGTGSVKGILVNASVLKVALAAGKKASDINDSTIINTITKAARKFKRNGAKMKFYMSQYVYGKLKGLLTTDGYPVYPELRNANPTIMGYAVVMSDIGFVQDLVGDVANAVTMLFGDLGYFLLARRKGITLERGYYGDNRKKDIQSLKSNTRYGGTCTFPEALTIVVNGA